MYSAVGSDVMAVGNRENEARDLQEGEHGKYFERDQGCVVE